MQELFYNTLISVGLAQYGIFCAKVCKGGIKLGYMRIEANSKILFLILSKNVCYDPSLQPSQGDGSTER